jgi:hypothetical protein
MEANHRQEEKGRGVTCKVMPSRSRAERPPHIPQIAFGRHARAGAGFIVGDGFEIVGAAEEGPQLRVEARIVLDKSPNSPCTRLWLLVKVDATGADFVH